MKLNGQKLCLCLLLGALVSSTNAVGVDVKSWFPDNPGMEVVPGKVSTAIIGVRNMEDSPVNVTAAFAELALVSAPEGSVYNFSALGYSVPELQPAGEAIVQYSMLMPYNLPPRDFILRLSLVWSQGEQMFSSLAYKDTISVIEAPKLIDTELVGLYLILLGGIAAAGYFGLNVAKKQGWLKKSKKYKPVVASSNDDKSEWLKGTVADKSRKQS